MRLESKIERLEARAERLPVVSQAEMDADIERGIAEAAEMLAQGMTPEGIIAFYTEGTTGARRDIIADIAGHMVRLAGGRTGPPA